MKEYIKEFLKLKTQEIWYGIKNLIRELTILTIIAGIYFSISYVISKLTGFRLDNVWFFLAFGITVFFLFSLLTVIFINWIKDNWRQAKLNVDRRNNEVNNARN